ncbi:hypothetical protein AK830_g4852 [Neonectria ditissima]|uniref:Amine oxidase n=1 Tax=Neonectria ditissima TaxID=78410 RepID=A0A0P7BKD9_9HYPO|nr:hypothetical protein AK830_g4852 [Neonectria ditissima]
MSTRSSRQRPMTFTGCWTCKARKVRCDERPSACRNCETRGIPCGGYDIRLQWMSDPFAQPATSSSRGRRSIRLDRAGGHRYRMKEITDFLSTIDSHAETGLALTKGPFSTFPICHSKATPPCDFDTPSELPQESRGIAQSDDHILSLDLDHDSVCGTEMLSLNSTTAAPQCISASTFSNEDESNSFDDASFAAGSIVDVEESTDQGDALSNTVTCSISSTETNRALWMRDCVFGSSSSAYSTFSCLNSLPIQHVQTSLFGNPEADLLMHHYMIHVADVLLPIIHPQNPYRGLYVPTALEGATFHGLDPRATKTKVHSALYNALLASAAFHLWNCDRTQSQYQKMGLKHRHQALRSLQAAVNTTTLAADHQILLMAMLSLVTIGVMSGEDDGFMVHLKGIAQLRNSRRRWRIISGPTRQLNEISAFLALMARTTSLQVHSSTWVSENDDVSNAEDTVIHSGSCYGYMYGITPQIAAAIQETCRLAEFAAQYDRQGHEAIPDDLLEACEALGNRLLSWSLESEATSSIPANDTIMLMIFNLQANAWHHAALIYYYCRIQRYNASDLTGEVERVAEYMHAAEDAKAGIKFNRASIMAPITWPMFIASFNAVGSQRDECRAWWERVQHYGIANIRRQWDIIQQVWKDVDEPQQKGHGSRSWAAILVFEMAGIVDVVVIGAGLSGLQAALDIHAAGRSVAVLESRDRVGGKTSSIKRFDGKGIQEAGAAWLNDTNQSHVWSYVKKFGLSPVVQNIVGSVASEDANGDCHMFPFGEMPKFGQLEIDNTTAMRDMVETASLDHATFDQPKRGELDSINFEQWLRDSGAGTRALQTARLWCRGTLGQDPSEVSALAFLEIARGGLGIVKLRYDGKDGAQFLRLQEGTQSISFGMAEMLPRGSIILSSPVTSVAQHTSKLYTVTTANGHALNARKVIVSIPSPTYRNISFTPPLPLQKQMYTTTARYGCYIKFVALFKTPFWRERGACGLAQSFRGPINHCRDTSVDDQGNYALACFLCAGPGRKWAALSDEERCEAILEQLGSLFEVGYDAVKTEFLGSITSEWMQDRWAGWGCPLPATPPGAMGSGADGERIAEKFGGVYFVGTELTNEWRGYMEGALRSGKRGAAQALSDLGADEVRL